MNSEWTPTKADFETPTPQLIAWLQQNLMYYEEEGNQKAISIFRELLDKAKAKNPVYIRSISEGERITPKKLISMFDVLDMPQVNSGILIQRQFNQFTQLPEYCDPNNCPNVHCESRRPENKGARCVYAKPLTNQDIKQQAKIVYRDAQGEIEKEIDRIFQPITKRLERIEQKLKKVEEPANPKPKPLKESLDPNLEG